MKKRIQANLRGIEESGNEIKTPPTPDLLTNLDDESASNKASSPMTFKLPPPPPKTIQSLENTSLYASPTSPSRSLPLFGSQPSSTTLNGAYDTAFDEQLSNLCSGLNLKTDFNNNNYISNNLNNNSYSSNNNGNNNNMSKLYSFNNVSSTVVLPLTSVLVYWCIDPLMPFRFHLSQYNSSPKPFTPTSSPFTSTPFEAKVPVTYNKMQHQSSLDEAIDSGCFPRPPPPQVPLTINSNTATPLSSPPTPPSVPSVPSVPTMYAPNVQEQWLARKQQQLQPEKWVFTRITEAEIEHSLSLSLRCLSLSLPLGSVHQLNWWQESVALLTHYTMKKCVK